MGNSASRDGSSKNKQINKKMKKDRKKDKYLIKLLLLGAGESGKSTIFKQIRLIHNNGFNAEETKEFIEIIHSNVILSMCDLIKGAANVEVDLAPVDADVEVVTCADKTALIDAQLGATIKKLFSSKELQQAWKQRTRLQVFDSLEYFVERIGDITGDNYVPTEQDILRTRVRTSGITEMKFKIDRVAFAIFDVGGQRSERRKWIHCFEDVTAVIFVAALSEYDQVLFEDGRTNRLKEALTVFDDVCNNDAFAKTSMILFLNKRDLFEAKIQAFPISDSFPDYDGGADYDAGVEFIKQKFMDLNRNPAQRLIYTHVTCATDTDNIAFVFDSVKDIILNANIAGSGMM